MGKTEAMFTITRCTTTGKQEVLTKTGFKTRKFLIENNMRVLWFTRSQGSEKVMKLRSNCRLPNMKRSILLNYS